MTDSPATSALAAARVVAPDGPERPLLEAVSRALHQRGCDDLDRVPVLGRRGGLPAELRGPALAYEDSTEAVPLELVDRLDAGDVASWITGHYPAGPYPAVVLGSAHGGAAHLAAALGAPWLPTSFTVTVPWPDGNAGDWTGAMEWGAKLADLILAADPGVTVRQVHDPLGRGQLCGSTVTLHVRWQRLPVAYRDFLGSGVEPGGAALLLRDTRTWPVLELTDRHSFQLGRPAGGMPHEDQTMENPSFRRLMESVGGDRWSTPYLDTAPRYAETAGEPELDRDLRRLAGSLGTSVHRVLYPGPEALSACVADLYREWLRASGRGGDECVVETGRLIDPWRVLRSGLVPYWCESSARTAVDGVEWWLAGSGGFAAVTILPEPPGTVCDVHAAAAQWRAVAHFGQHRTHLNRQALGRYPLLPLPTSHASSVLRARHESSGVPGRLPLGLAMSALRHSGSRLGLLVV
ncbi:hypothetical protein [Actinoplanes auranticolor]|uniref:Uncharacterized protein n=1 Tax=Actinoplanes auranticolor TaxID=47988 RepID=A0A919SEJ5_9ACTN|nr:hypothetical protein [Actinoplanes auranticolor]GIM70214.1 hypothetical protein Aau02nite_39950 [Actinoplanes auranticolor]